MAYKIKTKPETPISFQDSDTVPQPNSLPANFDLTGLLPNNGIASDVIDLGIGPRTTRFFWQAAGIPGSSTGFGNVEAYVVEVDSVVTPTIGQFNTPNSRNNLQHLGTVYCNTPSGVPFISSGRTEIFGRYVYVVWWNNTNVPLGSGNYFVLRPIPREIQDG
jgi:hypothetical protein